ncbi:hypothetical protein [Streptomyces actinomycinicus]|uniref:hypothetical protein n=1 Tax=Streptomyces actinomycinicus TaxID=1695166 RepID=UPI0027DA64BA|nr:hypothetical protein [Streptomyces actinomycinicus]
MGGTTLHQKFANDLIEPQLIAVSASSNRAKGDQSPDQWAPPLHSYWCTYSEAWTYVKYVYHLNTTEAEENKLNEMLDTCESRATTRTPPGTRTKSRLGRAE